MSIVKLCPYDKDEHCKYEIYYGEPVFSKCKNCEIKNSCRYETKKKKNTKSKGVTMFEKEAEEYRKDLKSKFFLSEPQLDLACQGFKDGYNKSNEWYYPSKGEYPKEYKDILICFLTEDDMKDCVRGWYEYDFEDDKHIFKYLNVLGTQYLKTVIAWKEIVLPKEIE